MVTAKVRINISLPDEARAALARVARRDRVPQATKAARLLEIALELEEDDALNAIAEGRDVPRARYLAHTKAWK